LVALLLAASLLSGYGSPAGLRQSAGLAGRHRLARPV